MKSLPGSHAEPTFSLARDYHRSNYRLPSQNPEPTLTYPKPTKFLSKLIPCLTRTYLELNQSLPGSYPELIMSQPLPWRCSSQRAGSWSY